MQQGVEFLEISLAFGFGDFRRQFPRSLTLPTTTQLCQGSRKLAAPRRSRGV
jgi:hypothetical protein